MKTVMIDLGFVLGRIQVIEATDQKYSSQYDNALLLMSQEDLSEGYGYKPAQSVYLFGEHVFKLRDALNEHFPVEVK